jgi:hypothetical protein
MNKQVESATEINNILYSMEMNLSEYYSIIRSISDRVSAIKQIPESKSNENTQKEPVDAVEKFHAMNARLASLNRNLVDINSHLATII